MDARKRGRFDAGISVNGGFKKTKQELESLSTGVGSKSKPCTKFFSTAGCPFGEGCHFLHYVPGGYNAVAQMMNLACVTPAASRKVAAPPPVHNGSTPAVKTRICNKYNSAEGCKFGDKCHYAHGEWELNKPVAASLEDHRAVRPFAGRIAPHRMEPAPGPVTNFGMNASTKFSVDASLAGAIIGKGGVTSKQICRQTGAKLSIRDHESDQNLRYIEFEGTMEQTQEASNMVGQLLATISMSAPPRNRGAPGGPAPPGSNYKTKMCENFAKGSCTFGERCHFAHGAAELRKTAA